VNCQTLKKNRRQICMWKIEAPRNFKQFS